MTLAMIDFVALMLIMCSIYRQLKTARELKAFVKLFTLTLTPKEQPPRKLSGKWIASFLTFWKAEVIKLSFFKILDLLKALDLSFSPTG